MPSAQLQMIENVKSLALADDNINAVLMYGSFIKGEGDKHSDIEFYLFHKRDFNHALWVAQVRPHLMFFKNEYETEVAIFDNLIRGEFHFQPDTEMEAVKSWEGFTSFEHADNMSLVDKDGRLRDILATISRARPTHGDARTIEWLAMSLLNNLLMTQNLLARGEAAHCHQAFQFIQKYLIWLIRLADGADNHWENPTKRLEAEISAARYAVFKKCVPDLTLASLEKSLAASIDLATGLFAALGAPDTLRATLLAVKTTKS